MAMIQGNLFIPDDGSCIVIGEKANCFVFTKDDLYLVVDGEIKNSVNKIINEAFSNPEKLENELKYPNCGDTLTN